MTDVSNYAPQPLLDRIRIALSGMFSGAPGPGAGPPNRFGTGPTSGENAPGFDLVSRIIQEVRNEATSKPSARTRGPGPKPPESSQPGRGPRHPNRPPAGTRSIPIPVNPRGADIAATAQPYPPGPAIHGPGLFSVPSGLTGSPSSGIVTPPPVGAGPPSIPGAGPQLSPEEIAKLLFTPPPAGSTPAAASVNGPPIPPAGPDYGPPRGGVPPPTFRPDAGPQPSAIASPVSPSVASPMVAPPPIDPRAAGQGTLGPEFLAGMDPRMIAALLGLGRGRQ
jgi:hypothetical protein